MAEVRSGTLQEEGFPPRKEAYPIGMWLCHHETASRDFLPVREAYANLLASFQVGDKFDRWTYSVHGKEESGLWVRRGEDIDVYAYYPHAVQPPATTPDAVEVAVDPGTDLLWSGPVRLTPEETDREEVYMTLPFRHAMACIHLKILSRYAKPVRLESIRVSDARSRLCSRAYFDIVTGKLTRKDRLSAWSLSPGLTLEPGQEQECLLLLPPLEDYHRGECVLSFRFDDDKRLWLDYALPDHIGGRPLSSLEAGRRYVYRLVLDKTLYFSPMEMSDHWIDIETELKM